MANHPRIVLAEEREMGVPCAQCGREIRLGDPTAICRDCGGVHHAPCWHANHGCAAYECAAPSAAGGQSPMLSISHAELAAAEPIVARSTADNAAQGGGSFSTAVTKRLNRTAVWAFAIALVGILLFSLIFSPAALVAGGVGMLLGLVAVVIGSVALAGHTRRHRGLAFAVVGMLLGLGDIIGWSYGLASSFGHDLSTSAVSLDEMTFDFDSLKELPERTGRTMRANVLIQTSAGLGRRGIGSGVILKLLGGSAFIVTNRHVIDHGFTDGMTSVPQDLGALAKVMVTTVEQLSVPGKVEWIAPHGIDLAIVSAPVVSGEVREAHWDGGVNPHLGDTVYAVGNPIGLGWSRSAGDISQIRTRNNDGFSYRILQTTAAINPGNSGGGLYDAEGRLVGINTLTSDKRFAEGLSFSISFPTLLKLIPESLGVAGKNLPKGSEAKATDGKPAEAAGDAAAPAAAADVEAPTK